MFTKKQVIIVVLVVLAAFLIAKMGGFMGSEEEVGESNMGKVKFTTNKGAIVIELYDSMPITAGNFKKLASEGFYDGTRFHRVISGFMIQGGDPLSKDLDQKARWGTGGSEEIADEHVEGSSNLKYTISMANSGPNSGSSQFFINLADNTFLDWDKAPSQSKHPVFGKVVEGIDIVEAIGRAPVNGNDQPLEDVIVEKAEVL